MKLTLLVLFSYSCFAISEMDLKVFELQKLNGDVQADSEDRVCGFDNSFQSCERVNELNLEKLNQFYKCPSQDQIYNQDKFYNYIFEDATSDQEYIYKPGKIENFLCQHFSTQTYLRGSCFANEEDIATYEEHTSIRASQNRIAKSNQQPILYLNFSSDSNGFHHAINAIFIGDTPEEMGDLNNYLLFEPQSDTVFHSLSELRQHYSKYNLPDANDLEFHVRHLTKPGFISNGSLQFSTDLIASFKCKNVTL